jgi:hypothetical protein
MMIENIKVTLHNPHMAPACRFEQLCHGVPNGGMKTLCKGEFNIGADTAALLIRRFTLSTL